ncbi:hypothetical protein F2Q69_00001281 [Brassica cretica]|uniref:Uncharacterized protein n=1 Tax=Brassica cretica TaxID=69181 RepID=A0A8S9NYW8_BRACR|nr:hypothetical protein F2Q69_00001281 [Brassica cretica]
MFEALKYPIDFWIPRSGSRDSSFNVELLRCFDEVTGDEEEVGVRFLGCWPPLLCLGVLVVDMKKIKSKSKDMKNMIDHGQEIMDRRS